MTATYKLLVLIALNAIVSVSPRPGSINPGVEKSGNEGNKNNPVPPSSYWLYGQGQTEPGCDHIKQSQITNDCWLTAAMCAIAHAKRTWITHNIFEPETRRKRYVGPPSAAKFRIWDDDGKTHEIRVTHADVEAQKARDLVDMKGNAWWPGGYDLAVAAMGGFGHVKEGQPSPLYVTGGGGNASSGIHLLSGNATILDDIPRNAKDPEEGKEDFMRLTSTAPGTPIVIGTYPEGKADNTKLLAGHAYAVKNSWVEKASFGGGETRLIVLWNPAGGADQQRNVDEIWELISSVGHLKDMAAP